MQRFYIKDGVLLKVECGDEQFGFDDPVEAVASFIRREQLDLNRQQATAAIDQEQVNHQERSEMARRHQELVERAESDFPGLFRAADVDEWLGQDGKV